MTLAHMDHQATKFCTQLEGMSAGSRWYLERHGKEDRAGTSPSGITSHLWLKEYHIYL
jgi:hypothetical protein